MNLTLTGYIEGKKNRGKPRITEVNGGSRTTKKKRDYEGSIIAESSKKEEDMKGDDPHPERTRYTQTHTNTTEDRLQTELFFQCTTVNK